MCLCAARRGLVGRDAEPRALLPRLRLPQGPGVLLQRALALVGFPLPSTWRQEPQEQVITCLRRQCGIPGLTMRDSSRLLKSQC